MSGTKYAPATLSREEQARIRKALEEATRINEMLGQAAAAATLCRVTIDGLDARARAHLEDVVAQTEQACRQTDDVRADVARNVHQVQEGLNRALAIQNARALPAIAEHVRLAAATLEEQVRALEARAGQIIQLAGSVAADDAATERYRAQQRKARLRSSVEQLRSRLATDPSFEWIAADACDAIAEGDRRLEGDVAVEDCLSFEAQLRQLCDRAFEAERLYHERRRTADLVRTLFAGSGYEVSSMAEPPHGSRDDIASSFKPADEQLLVTVVARHPWERDQERRQLLHLTMTARSTSEESTDPFCIERLRDFALRARELGIEIGDVLQPLPGGGYECVLSAESVGAGEQAAGAAAGRTSERHL